MFNILFRKLIPIVNPNWCSHIKIIADIHSTLRVKFFGYKFRAALRSLISVAEN